MVNGLYCLKRSRDNHPQHTLPNNGEIRNRDA